MAILSRSKLYTVWNNMKVRCLKETNYHYKYYGQRGITICEKWLKFQGFFKDMSGDYEEGLTLDRIDNNKGYFKENCRWTTMKVQNNNKRWNRNIELNGINKNLSQWAVFLGLKRSTLAQRFYVYRWSMEKCFYYQKGRIST